MFPIVTRGQSVFVSGGVIGDVDGRIGRIRGRRYWGAADSGNGGRNAWHGMVVAVSLKQSSVGCNIRYDAEAEDGNASVDQRLSSTHYGDSTQTVADVVCTQLWVKSRLLARSRAIRLSIFRL